MGAAGVSWCLAPSELLFLRYFHRQTDGWTGAHTESLVCISQSPHSTFFRLHLPVPAAFGSSPCSHLSIPTPALLSASAQAQRHQTPFLRVSNHPPEPSLVSNSPVLRCCGCWATVSLLALCPILRRLFPLACLGLPLPRPQAAEQNLKPPQGPSPKHGVCVASDRPSGSFPQLALTSPPCSLQPV